MTDWYLYDEGGAHRGPLSTETLAQAIRAKVIPRDVWVTAEAWFEAPGASGWHRVDDIPEIREKLAAMSASDLRMVDGAFTQNRLGTPEFGATVMMVGSSRPPPPKKDD
ncbi:MAG TPA: hypothetical protein VM925_19030 [Labilithrix sp.]|nr:hypothetical protein [Labilithrix sp.]